MYAMQPYAAQDCKDYTTCHKDRHTHRQLLKPSDNRWVDMHSLHHHDGRHTEPVLSRQEVLGTNQGKPQKTLSSTQSTGNACGSTIFIRNNNNGTCTWVPWLAVAMQ
eukprot:scpid80189/ scgid29293/ 